MPAILFPLFDALRVAAVAAAAALAIGAWPAWTLATREFRWKRETLAVLAFLELTPTLVFGYLLLPVFPWPLAIAVSLLQGVPYVLRATRAAFLALPPDYTKAALLAGASDRAVFRRIAMPLNYRPILMAALGVFTFTLLQFAATLLIAHRLRGRS